MKVPLVTFGHVVFGHVVLIAACCSVVGCESGSGIDSSMNSFNVAQHLSYDDEYPSVGFWKLESDDDFGLAIDKHRDGQYTIWFCSPRSSVEVETLSPTTLADDANFNVIDEHTIEVLDKHGQFSTYTRFQ